MAGSNGVMVEKRSFNIILLGSTGAGKSTLVNTMVNYFRGSPDLRKRLPAVAELKVAVPTAFLAVTEDEGKKAKELNVKDRKWLAQRPPCAGRLHSTSISASISLARCCKHCLSRRVRFSPRSHVRLTPHTPLQGANPRRPIVCSTSLSIVLTTAHKSR